MISEQCRMARSALQWSAEELAKRAGVGANTVRRFEAGQNSESDNIERIRRVFENNGIRFIGSSHNHPGVEMHQQIWRLVPNDLNDPNWEASTHKGPVLVRAPSERIARQRAKIAFVIATRRRIGEDVRFCPWDFPNLVTAERISSNSEGPTAIIEPHYGEHEVPSQWDTALLDPELSGAHSARSVRSTVQMDEGFVQMYVEKFLAVATKAQCKEPFEGELEACVAEARKHAALVQPGGSGASLLGAIAGGLQMEAAANEMPEEQLPEKLLDPRLNLQTRIRVLRDAAKRLTAHI